MDHVKSGRRTPQLRNSRTRSAYTLGYRISGGDIIGYISRTGLPQLQWRVYQQYPNLRAFQHLLLIGIFPCSRYNECASYRRIAYIIASSGYFYISRTLYFTKKALPNGPSDQLTADFDMFVDVSWSAGRLPNRSPTSNSATRGTRAPLKVKLSLPPKALGKA